MKAADWDDSVLARIRERAGDPGVIDAFDYLVSEGIRSQHYLTKPLWQGSKNLFIYEDPVSHERPFSFIVNVHHLLFYVRLPGQSRVQGGYAELLRRFPSASPADAGQWKVKVMSREEAERLNSFLFSNVAVVAQSPVTSRAKIHGGIGRLTSAKAVEAAMAEFDRIGRTEFLSKYEFGRAREYMLKGPSGALYDSKAIVGAALGYQYPDEGALTCDDFSGGEETVEPKLRELGFEVIRVGDPWSRREVELAVAEYFQMLTLEARGEPFNKAERNAELRRRLERRSKGSIELKHQNISAILDELGLPFIRGYKPRGNVQELLRDVVWEQVDRQRALLTRVVDDFEMAKTPDERGFVGVLVDPPRPQFDVSAAPKVRIPRKLDFADRDERNRAIGRAGEKWVMGYEGERLVGAGYPELVPKVSWVSEVLGDGAGYDIQSYTDVNSERFIEVKTTNGGPLAPFVLTANELRFSKEAGDAFFLYRLFQYSSDPRLFTLRGDLEESLSLSPMDYRARLKALG